jgi:hypothetical protein
VDHVIDTLFHRHLGFEENLVGAHKVLKESCGRANRNR